MDRSTAGLADVVRALAVTAEITQTELSRTAARVMAEDLAVYPAEQVLRALVRCRRELTGRERLTIAAVIARLDDGRPGPNEAWAMIPRDEHATVVWTEEMQQAHAVALPLIAAGEIIPARMAFIEAYAAAIATARSERRPARWIPSLGFDKRGREAVLEDAVRLGRLTAAHVAKLLPPPSAADALPAVLAAATSHAVIISGDSPTLQ